MPLPTVNPTTAGQPNYTVANSKAFIAVFQADINALGEEGFTVTFPANLAGVSFSLTHVDTASQQRLTVPLPAGGAVAHYTVAGQLSPANNELTVNITETGGGSVTGELWELRASANVPASWTMSVSGTNVDVKWLAVDPVAALTVPATAFEQETVELNAANASSSATVAGSVPSDLTPTYTWTHTGAIPITELPATTITTTASSLKITPPGVYEPVPVPFTVTTTFSDPAGVYAGFLRSVSPPATTTVRSRPQRIVLVVDRSGSMALENRFENAKIACRVLVHLFAGLREGVNAGDRVAIVAFEGEQAGFRAGPPSTLIKALLPLTPLPAAVAAIDDPAFDFGAPGTNTPIGDGLIFAIDLLAAAGPVTDQRSTVLLVSDGQNNSGHVALTAATAVNGAITFTQAIASRDERKAVFDPKRCSLFAIALGPTADQQALTDLVNILRSQQPENQPGRSGEFNLVSNPAELAGSFGHMLESSQTVNAVVNQTTPTTGTADPNAASFPPGANAVYFSTDGHADRLVLAVTPPAGSTVFTGDIQLARFDGAGYVPEATTILSTASDRATSVSKLPILGGENPIHWRVIHGSGPTSAEPLAIHQVLSYVDLHLRADVLLDRPSYRTGDRMILTVRIRQDAAPVLGATVRAKLTATAAGLGEELSALGNASTLELAGGMDQTGMDRDAPTWVERRIGTMLSRRKWSAIPTVQPTAIFVDGTDQLFDPDGDGNYTNTFNGVLKEGTYSWELSVQGSDLNHNPFSRALSISTFAAVKVDTRATTIKVIAVPNHPSGQLAARVIMTPQDATGQRVGPGKDDAVIWALREGTFEHVLLKQPAPVFADGTYQRVVLYRHIQRPMLQMKAEKVLLPAVDIRRSVTGL